MKHGTSTYTSIKVHKAPHEKWYVQFPIEALNQAARELTPNELKLYLMLSENKDGYIVRTGPAQFKNKMGASGSSAFKNALDGLFSKGYCVNPYHNRWEYNTCDCVWDFYQFPRRMETHGNKYRKWIHELLDSLDYHFDYDVIENECASYNQQGIRDEEIFYTLYYVYIELQKNPARSNGHLGIVGVCVDDAMDYFKLKLTYPTWE